MAYYSKNVTIEEGAAGLGAIARRPTAMPFAGRRVPAELKTSSPACISFYRSGMLTVSGVKGYCDTGAMGGIQTSLRMLQQGSPKKKSEALARLRNLARQGMMEPSYVEWAARQAHLAGLGEDGAPGIALGPGVLDLRDQAALTELKTAIAMTGIMGLVASEEGQKIWPASFYVSPGWDGRATKLWEAAIAAYPELAAQTTIAPDGAKYPNAQGVMSILAKGVAAPGGDPTMFEKSFPKLAAWYMAAVRNPGAASVAAPEFTVAPAPSKMDMTYVYGGAAVLALGLALVVSRRKKRAA